MSDRRQLLAVMFTDIQGFSAMTAADEARTVRVVREHREVVRACLAAHGGREMRTVGDAFLVLFESAVAAVSCAIDIQERMAARNAAVSAADQVWMRIGVHAGEVVVGHEGELYGETVNLAARVEPHAPAGGLCVTDVVHAQVRSHVRRAFEPMGVVPLKGVADPPALFRLAVGRSAAPRRRSWRPVMAGGASLLALASLAVLAWSLTGGRSTPPRLVVSEVPEAQAAYEDAMEALAELDDASFAQKVRAGAALDPSSHRLQLARFFSEPDPTLAADLRAKGVAMAPAGPDGDFARLVDRALREGDDPAVANAWDAWGAAHPEDVEGQLIRALLYPAHGEDGLESHHGGPHDHGPTVELRRFVDAYPDHLTGRLNLAARERGDGHPEAAYAQLEEASKRCRSCAAVHHARAGMLTLDRRFEDADREYRAALELQPGRPGVREELAQVALFRGDEEERARRVEALLADEDSPAVARSQFALAHAGALIGAGRFAEGRALLDRSLALADPVGRTVALGQWFDLELLFGHADACREVLKRLQEAAADPEVPGDARDTVAVRVPHLQVLLAFLDRDLDRARTLEARVRALPPERFVGVDRQPILDVNARVVAALEGRTEDALALARKPAPNCGRSLNEADLHLLAGDLDAARGAYEEAAGHPTSDGPCQVISWVGAAELALAAGDRPRAAELAGKARDRWAKADPDVPWVARLAAVEAALAGVSDDGARSRTPARP